MAIKYEKRDGVAYITLNNPEKANILDKADLGCNLRGVDRSVGRS